MRILVVVSCFVSLLSLGSGCDKGQDEKTKAAPQVGDAKSAEAATPGKEGAEPESYGGEFCQTIIPCFQKHDFSGSFVANVIVDIEPDGSVSAVSFSGEAPKPVQTCINDEVEKIVLSPYNGKPGRARCSESGQLMGGTQMVMSDWGYEIRDPAEAPPAPEAAPEGGADAAGAAAEGAAADGEAAADGAAADGEAPAAEAPAAEDGAAADAAP